VARQLGGIQLKNALSGKVILFSFMRRLPLFEADTS
jgi:hypothetical protein